jgi:hypothetical protein
VSSSLPVLTFDPAAIAVRPKKTARATSNLQPAPRNVHHATCKCNCMQAAKKADGTCACVPFFLDGPCKDMKCKDGWLATVSNETDVSYHSPPVQRQYSALQHRTMPCNTVQLVATRFQTWHELQWLTQGRVAHHGQAYG